MCAGGRGSGCCHALARSPLVFVMFSCGFFLLLPQELEMIQRERAVAEAVELEKKEEEFHLEQVRGV